MGGKGRKDELAEEGWKTNIYKEGIKPFINNREAFISPIQAAWVVRMLEPYKFTHPTSDSPPTLPVRHS